MSLLLNRLGATVAGYALAPCTTPNLFEIAKVSEGIESWIADIRDSVTLTDRMKAFSPDVVFHLAAQSLVRESYRAPIETFDVNVMGTARVLEAVRQTMSVKAAVVVTSDKCYENHETGQAYREDDKMGGHDPYSASKGCAELVTSAYGRSFFYPGASFTSVASARAGNVVGGGDWANDRLLADIARGLTAGEDVMIRRPDAVRPWQHVLEPLHGYLRVAEHLMEKGPLACDAWNFGPDKSSERTVEMVARTTCAIWGRPDAIKIQRDTLISHEATLLQLDSGKARRELDWRPRWDFDTTLENTVVWYKAFAAGENMRAFTLAQIDAYRSAA
jgi:CDP-glucose 4,6-dehydratase